MRAWDLEDCQVALANLKQELDDAKSLIYELQSRVDDLEDSDLDCNICGHGLIDAHLPGCPNGDTSGEFLTQDERGTRLIKTEWSN